MRLTLKQIIIHDDVCGNVISIIHFVCPRARNRGLFYCTCNMMDHRKYLSDAAAKICRNIKEKQKPKDAQALAKILFDEMDSDEEMQGQFNAQQCLEFAMKCFGGRAVAVAEKEKVTVLNPTPVKSNVRKDAPPKKEPRATNFTIDYDECDMAWHSKLGAILGKHRVFYRFGEDCEDVVKVFNASGGIHVIDHAELSGNASQYATFTRQVKDKQGNEVVVPYRLTFQDARECLKSVRFIKELPRLKSVISRPMPRLIKRKIVLPRRGYNPATYEYYHPMPDAQNGIIDMDTQTAVDVVNEAIEEIFFETPDDRARYLCTMLDPFFDGFYSGLSVRGKVPLFACLGGQSGIGKEGTRRLINGIFGWRFEEQPAEVDKTEFYKLLGAAMEDGIQNFHIGEPGEGEDAQKVTKHLRSVVVSDLKPRLLGKSKKINVPDSIRISMSAKRDAIFDSDLPRRCLPICLFYEGDAKTYKWKRSDFDRWLENNQWRVFCALYKIVNEWWAAGASQKASEWNGSFHTWARFVGGIVEWAWGLDPFVVPPSSILASAAAVADPFEEVSDLIALIWEESGNAVFTGKEISGRASTIEGDPFQLTGDNPKHRKFNGTIKNSIGRIFNGLRIVRVTPPRTDGKRDRFDRTEFRIEKA